MNGRALFHMETVEHFARISLVARQLGGEVEFPPERVQQLIDSRGRYNAQVGVLAREETGQGTARGRVV